MRAFLGSIAATVGLFVIFFGCWFLAAGSSRAHVSVNNQSGTTISNLIISGSCKARRAEALATQSAWRTSTPYREGEISFSFDSAGVSYRTNIGVQSAFLVKVETRR